MKIAFEAGALADFVAWAEQDRKIQKRSVTLIAEILRNPQQGIGKPEPLKHALRGIGRAELPASIAWFTGLMPTPLRSSPASITMTSDMPMREQP